MSSKNRNKKTPMFVSNMVTNYDFVDYTEPAQPAPSSFGNPNANLLSTPNPQFNQPALSSPKKAQNNWFDQMLQTQQQKSISSPKNGFSSQVQTNLSPKAESYQSNFNFNQSQNTGFSYGVSNPVVQREQVKPSFNKQYAFQKPQTNFFGSPQGNLNNQNVPSFKKSYQANYSSSVPQQQNKYQFSKKTEVSYQSTESSIPKPPANNFSSGFNYSQPVKTEKPKYQSPTNASIATSSSTSSSSGGGFSDESLVNSLPQPARSNILAMIRRNKGSN